MFVNKNMDRNDVLTDPARLVRLELENAGYDMDGIHIPKRVFLLADSLYDTMLSRNCGEYRYPLGGKLFVFHGNEETGFIKGHMCSPAIATQAEDLIAGGVEELIHIGFAGGLQTDLKPGDIVLTDGAYNDTAVARLYGFDKDFIGSTKTLTDELGEHLTKNAISFRRGKHWTTDAGYHETWGQIMDYREKGALCEPGGMGRVWGMDGRELSQGSGRLTVFDFQSWRTGTGDFGKCDLFRKPYGLYSTYGRCAASL